MMLRLPLVSAGYELKKEKSLYGSMCRARNWCNGAQFNFKP